MKSATTELEGVLEQRQAKPRNPVPGFLEFHLLKGPEAEDHTLYASHTVWKNRATFEAWTKSESVPRSARGGWRQQAAVSRAPQFEEFETVQTVGGGKAAVV
jgi:heme-degrading monooxygenase HmoA